MTPAAFIARAGQLLHGDAWPVPLARELGVNVRTLRRIAAAARDGADVAVPPGLVQDVRWRLQDRANDIQETLAVRATPCRSGSV